MKKIILVLTFIVLILCIMKKENTEIPEASIRFRVLANTNEELDQDIKKIITEKVLEKLEPTKNFTNINQTRYYLKNNLPLLEKTIDNTLKDNGISATYEINYGQNLFPEKIYNNKVYEEGEYESLVITLGKGEGDNFWCVLFPPICFLDDNENIEYKSWIKEIIDKYF